MPVTPIDLTALDADAVDAMQSELEAAVTARFPKLDIRHGVLHDLVLHLHALLMSAQRAEIEALRVSSSLGAVAANPDAASVETVDALLSNYRTVRRSSGNATGIAVITVDRTVPVVLAAGASFSDGTTTYVTSRTYVARTVGSVASPGVGDRVLTPLGNGTYAFAIPVTATTPGPVGSIRRGTALIPSAPPPGFTSAYAESDFTGGIEAETNAALISRLQAGLAAQVWGGRINIDAMIRAQSEFAGISSLSIVGYGDPEMLRDRDALFPVSVGGKCDIHARTASLPLEVSATLTATYLSVSSSGSIWQVSIPRDMAPGFYTVTQIRRPSSAADTAGYEVVEDVRSADTTGTVPAVSLTAVDAAYSRFQSAVIRFLDTDTVVTGLTPGVSTAQYVVSAAGMPLLADLQTFLTARDRRPVGGDVLVRGPVPCFVRAEFEIRRRSDADAPNLPAVVAAIASAAAVVGFSGRLETAPLLDAAASVLPEGCTIGGAGLFGRLRQPDGNWVYLRSSDALVIPNDPESGVSTRTVIFFLDSRSIVCSVVTVAAPEL